MRWRPTASSKRSVIGAHVCCSSRLSAVDHEDGSFLSVSCRSSRYSTVQYVCTVLILQRIQSCRELMEKRPASSRSVRWSETASLKPGCGWLPDDWMPEELLRKGMRSIAGVKQTPVTGYMPPLGTEPLRRLLARRLGDQGIDAAPEQVLLTDSGTHAIDLVC